MQKFYEVWDFETRNQIGTFESEADALALFDRLFELNGEAGVGELGLMRQEADPSGEYQPVLILDGTQYLARVAART